MDVKKWAINFKFDRKQFEGQVSEFQSENTKPMVRVHVRISERTEYVFIYYKVKPGELFWYDLSDQYMQAVAKKLTETLLNG